MISIIRQSFISLICVFHIVFVNAGENEADIKDVLLLNSYHPTFKWTRDITHGVLKELSGYENYRISVEYMDTKRFNQESHLEAIKQYFLEKYKTLSVDGIICSDNHAFEFILKHGDEIWGHVPVVFCGVNNIRDFTIDTTRFKGIAEDINIPGTLHLINQIQPELENLIVISDSTLSGRIFKESFLASVDKEIPNLNYALIQASSAEQLGRLLSYFQPEKTAIYLLSLYIPRDGTARDMIQEADFLRNCLDVPVYGNWDFLFGNFILGGVIINGTDQGTGAGRIMRKILSGEDVPFLTTTPEEIVIDYHQVQRLGINQGNIPVETRYINKTISYIEQYEKEITIIGVVFIFLMVIIIFLLRIIALKRHTTKLLQKSESRLDLAMEGANVGLWDADLQENKLYLNSRIARLLEKEDMSDLYLDINNWSSIIHPEDSYQLQEIFTMHQSNMLPSLSGELRLLTGKQNYKWFSFHGRITEWNESKPLRMTGILMDIHFQKEFENQLQISKERAEESDRLKSSFLANMSHEIRTPMNAIMGFSDLLLNGDINLEHHRPYIEMIRTSGESLLNLINDIIDISKIESGQFKLNQESFDLHKLLDNITLVTNTLITNKNKPIEFIVEKGSDNQSLTIISDPYRLEQVIYNLVNNAIKFTEKGKITLNYKLNHKNLVFSVKDTGIGIEDKNHNLVFERFRQINPGPSDNVAGTGLGLAISKSLVTLMGGSIKVNSELNKGSNFTFTIPYKTGVDKKSNPSLLREN